MWSKRVRGCFLEYNAYKKYYIWNLAQCIYENGKCYWQLIIKSIIENSLITCEEIIGTTKAIQRNLNGKK